MIALISVVFAGTFGLGARGQSAGPPPDSLAQVQSAQLSDAKNAHLWRVGAWGGVNALGGFVLVWASSRSAQSTRWHFGAMSAGWGLVNTGIAAGGLLTSGTPPVEVGPLWAAERQFHDVLLFNLGLNVAYSAVGATMLGASHYGVGNTGRWRGFGTSLILQGVGLLVLDGIAFWASRSRLSSLLDAGVQLSVHPAPARLALTLQS
ncbi:DUF6992 family protein [Salinibacter altiplanensis]|uniref:DUF6992 family protein n=1 Tax=Salinibacter altiplanensis TaxID=1803181 RepID=UPI001F28E845|nr:hypothetical protein [Salinibacter altiplanensis]